MRFVLRIVWFISLIGFLSPLAGATNLIVSDIDDTIKISHVLNKLDAASNANKWENQFLGMAATYRELALSRPQDKFFYLSNAPEILMGQNHQLFLKYHSFPDGKLLLRQSLFDSDFKLTTLRKLIQQWQPAEMILIGDNGESDTEIYAQIHKEFPKIQIRTYIHQPYSTKNKKEKGQALKPNQVGFVTSLDLAHLWTDQGLLEDTQFAALVDMIAPQILVEKDGQSTGTLAFPEWLDCRGAMNLVSLMDIFSDYEQRLAERCQQR